MSTHEQILSREVDELMQDGISELEIHVDEIADGAHPVNAGPWNSGLI